MFVQCGCFHISALVSLMVESLGSQASLALLIFADRWEKKDCRERKCPHDRKQPRVSRPLCFSGKGLVLSEEDVFFPSLLVHHMLVKVHSFLCYVSIGLRIFKHGLYI